MFRIGMIPTVNKPTRVTKQTASKDYHIITSSIIHTGFKSGIVKADIFDLPFYFLFCKYILPKKKMLTRNLDKKDQLISPISQ